MIARPTQNQTQVKQTRQKNWKPGDDIMWGDMMIAPDHPKYNEYASRLQAGSKPPPGLPLPPKRTQPATQGQTLGSSGSLFDSRPSTTPANPSQSFLIAEQEKLPPAPQPDSTKSSTEKYWENFVKSGRVPAWANAYPNEWQRLEDRYMKPKGWENIPKEIAPQQTPAPRTEANTQSNASPQPKAASGLPIKGYTGAAWADMGAQQSFQAHNFNKATSSTDAERIAASSQMMAQNNPEKWAVGPDGMLVDRKSFRTQTVAPLDVAPLDKLDSITQARDIHGNKIDSADMLGSGGVKLQKNQRAERRPGNNSGGSLQFRTVDGKVRVLGSAKQTSTPPSVGGAKGSKLKRAMKEMGATGIPATTSWIMNGPQPAWDPSPATTSWIMNGPQPAWDPSPATTGMR